MTSYQSVLCAVGATRVPTVQTMEVSLPTVLELCILFDGDYGLYLRQ